MVSVEFEKTSEGLELVMATNHFGPFLLTNLLLGKTLAIVDMFLIWPILFAHCTPLVDQRAVCFGCIHCGHTASPGGTEAN